MSIISKDKNMIKIFYNSNSIIGKQTLAYIESSYKDILAIDTEKTKVTGTQWADLCDGLNCRISDLVDKGHPSFSNHYDSSAELDEEDWIKVLNSHQEVFVNPIVIMGHQLVQINNPSDIEKLLAPNSEGLDEQNP